MGGVDVNTFGNTGTSDLFGLNFIANNQTISSNGSNGLNGSNNMNSFGAGTNGGNFVSTASNVPSSLNNTLSSSSNLVSKIVFKYISFFLVKLILKFSYSFSQFGANLQHNSTGIIANRQNSLSNFGNTKLASSFSLNENTPMSFTTTSSHEFGQLQQFTTSNSALQQQQKNSFNTFNQNSNNHLFSTSGNGLMRNTSNTNFPGWPNTNYE